MLGSVRSRLLSALFSCTGLTLGFRFSVVPQAEAGVGVEKSPWGQTDVESGRLAPRREDGSQPARASEAPSSAQNRQQHWWPWGR